MKVLAVTATVVKMRHIVAAAMKSEGMWKEASACLVLNCERCSVRRSVAGIFLYFNRSKRMPKEMMKDWERKERSEID